MSNRVRGYLVHQNSIKIDIFIYILYVQYKERERSIDAVGVVSVRHSQKQYICVCTARVCNKSALVNVYSGLTPLRCFL